MCYFLSKISFRKTKVLLEKLETAEYVSLTTDMWTSIGSNDAYMTVTSHFIDNDGMLNDFVLDTQSFGDINHNAENLHLYLTAQTAKWNIEKKTEVIVTDNARNITNAVELSGYESLKCAGHTLNLCVKDILETEEKIQNLLSKCRSIVGHFKRSAKATQKFKRIQDNLGLKKHKLIQEACFGLSFFQLYMFF